MAEYIERHALWKKIAHLQEKRERDGQLLLAKALDMVLRLIEQVPAADVVPVVHGRWERTEDGDWECTNCKESVVICVCGKDVTAKKNVCPNCGAHMKDGE